MYEWYGIRISNDFYLTSALAKSPVPFPRPYKLGIRQQVRSHCKKTCTCGVCVVYVWCTCGVRVVYEWCTCGVRVVYVRCTCGVSVVYVWCTCGVRAVHVWCKCGVSVVYVCCAKRLVNLTPLYRLTRMCKSSSIRSHCKKTCDACDDVEVDAGGSPFPLDHNPVIAEGEIPVA